MSDALIVVGSMVAFTLAALFVVAGAPAVVSEIREDTNVLLFAIGGILIGGAVATRRARAAERVS